MLIYPYIRWQCVVCYCNALVSTSSDMNPLPYVLLVSLPFSAVKKLFAYTLTHTQCTYLFYFNTVNCDFKVQYYTISVYNISTHTNYKM